MKKKNLDPNLKLPIKTVQQLKILNAKFIDFNFDNIKVLNSIAVDQLVKQMAQMTKNEQEAFLVSEVYKLQKRGIVHENARSIGG